MGEVERMMFRKRSVAGVVAAALVLASCSPAAPIASPTPGATVAASATPSEWETTLAAARQEGEVIVWGQSGATARQHEKDAFEKAYPGITVTLFQAPSSSERDARFTEEFNAGIASLDVFVGGAGGGNANLKPAGMLQDLRPFLVLPEVRDPQNWMNNELVWVDAEQMYMIHADININPALAAHESVDVTGLTSWEDILDPMFKGKIVMGDPRQSGSGFAFGLFLYYGLGPEFTQRFYSEMDVTFSQDERQNVDSVVSGQSLLYLNAPVGEVVAAQGAGATIHVVPTLEWTGETVAGVGGSDGIAFVPNIELPHPNAAKVYINWFYSRDGQQALVDILGRGSRRVDVDHTSLPEYARPDPAGNYLTLLHFVAPDVAQTMRDDISKWVQ